MAVRNTLLAIVNLLLLSLPVLLTWDITFYGAIILFYVILILLLFWNPLGDWLIVHFVLRAQLLPTNALVKAPIDEYILFLKQNNIDVHTPICCYYTTQKLPYFFSISKKRFILSQGLEEPIIAGGTPLLINRIKLESFENKNNISRKILLLTIIEYYIMAKIMELWAIIFVLAVKLIMIIVVWVVSGGLFAKKPLSIIQVGSALGALATKINDLINYLQDHIVEWLIKTAVMGHLNVVEKDNSII